jgi:hypothetical protein
MFLEIYSGFFYTIGAALVVVPTYIILSKYRVNQGQQLMKDFSKTIANLFPDKNKHHHHHKKMVS